MRLDGRVTAKFEEIAESFAEARRDLSSSKRQATDEQVKLKADLLERQKATQDTIEAECKITKSAMAAQVKTR